MFKTYINDEQFNFQINRFMEPYYNNPEIQTTIETAVDQIKDQESWYEVWNKLGIVAEEEDKNGLASAYYQLADFFLPENDVRKKGTYVAFKRTFYNSIDTSNIEFDDVPYEGKALPIAKISHSQATKTLLFHGGFDSYLEEIIRLSLNEGLANLKDYNLILFEGPGQGKALKDGIPMTYKWEKPVSTILNYYHLDHADLMGMSLGGFLAMRAAAFETRIEKVIAFDVYYNMLDSFTMKLPEQALSVIEKIDNPVIAAEINHKLAWATTKNVDLDFKIRKGNEIMGTKQASDLIKEVKHYTLEGIEDKITQDVLLLAGDHDMYVPTPTLDHEAELLVGANSITKQMFNKESGGERHCQVGNKSVAFAKVIEFLAG
ncbi:alpha/beta fold hydrolase [Liquorilactobacillus mali]|uniref:alpha/beta fold hydrolase n=1 Tax=Liquorilactobacillus mali TaxID=1618 RepID=UPI00234FF17D|nr:alpha/beta hydrolase [Liquorilactobacillus mali]MDC7952554.1 alpha/beta hydrolase [Liquorilactobacillus mali]